MQHSWIRFVKEINAHHGCRTRSECSRILEQLIEHMNASFSLTQQAKVFVKTRKQIISPHQMRVLWPIKIYLKSRDGNTIYDSAVKLWLQSSQHEIQPQKKINDIFERSGHGVATFLQSYATQQPDNMFGFFMPRRAFRLLFNQTMNPKSFWMQVYSIQPEMRPHKRSKQIWIPSKDIFQDNLDQFKLFLKGGLIL